MMDEQGMRQKIIQELIQHLADSDGQDLKNDMHPPDAMIAEVEPPKTGIAILGKSDGMHNPMDKGSPVEGSPEEEANESPHEEMNEEDMKKLIDLYSRMK